MLVLPAKGGEQLWHEVFSGVVDAEIQSSTLNPSEPVQYSLCISKMLVDVPAIAMQLLAGFSQENSLADLFEQRNIEVFFELLDLDRNGGLCRTQLFRRTCEVQVPGDGLENDQLSESCIFH